MAAMRRLLTAIAVLGFVAWVIVLAALATMPVKTNFAVPVSCGSLLNRVEPDPTAEAEFGCADLFAKRGQQLVVVGAFGGGLVAAVALAAFAQAVAARAATRPDGPETTTPPDDRIQGPTVGSPS
jgi:predicted membrane metal-binding protein